MIVETITVWESLPYVKAPIYWILAPAPIRSTISDSRFKQFLHNKWIQSNNNKYTQVNIIITKCKMPKSSNIFKGQIPVYIMQWQITNKAFGKASLNVFNIILIKEVCMCVYSSKLPFYYALLVSIPVHSGPFRSIPVISRTAC